jgi:hypothetical protein
MYKDFLAAYINLEPAPALPALPPVPEASDGAPVDPANPVVPRLALFGVEFPPLERDQELLALLQTM